jgi:hypothetical protein
VAIEVRGVQVELIGMKIAVKNVAGGLQQMKHIVFAGVQNPISFSTTSIIVPPEW